MISLTPQLNKSLVKEECDEELSLRPQMKSFAKEKVDSDEEEVVSLKPQWRENLNPTLHQIGHPIAEDSIDCIDYDLKELELEFNEIESIELSSKSNLENNCIDDSFYAEKERKDNNFDPENRLSINPEDKILSPQILDRLSNDSISDDIKMNTQNPIQWKYVLSSSNPQSLNSVVDKESLNKKIPTSQPLSSTDNNGSLPVDEKSVNPKHNDSEASIAMREEGCPRTVLNEEVLTREGACTRTTFNEEVLTREAGCTSTTREGGCTSTTFSEDVLSDDEMRVWSKSLVTARVRLGVIGLLQKVGSLLLLMVLFYLFI